MTVHRTRIGTVATVAAAVVVLLPTGAQASSWPIGPSCDSTKWSTGMLTAGLCKYSQGRITVSCVQTQGGVCTAKRITSYYFSGGTANTSCVLRNGTTQGGGSGYTSWKMSYAAVVTTARATNVALFTDTSLNQSRTNSCVQVPGNTGTHYQWGKTVSWTVYEPVRLWMTFLHLGGASVGEDYYWTITV